MKMSSNHQKVNLFKRKKITWHLYEIDSSDLKINNINHFDELLESDYLSLHAGYPNLSRYQPEDDCLQEVDSKLQEIWDSMTSSLIDIKNYYSKLGEYFYKEASSNLESLNSIKPTFNVEKNTSDKLSETISHTRSLVLGFEDEDALIPFKAFKFKIREVQETFKELLDRFIFSFNEYLTICHLQNFSSEYQEIRSIFTERELLERTRPKEELVDPNYLKEIKNRKVLSSSLLVIAISFLALIFAGLVIGVGDIGESLSMVLISILFLGLSVGATLGGHPWGIISIFIFFYYLWQAIVLSPFLLFLLPAVFIVPWLIISSKSDAEYEFNQDLRNLEISISKKNRTELSSWHEELDHLLRVVNYESSNLKPKLVSSLVQKPDLSYLSQKDDKRLKRLTDILPDFNELIQSYASLEKEILNLNNEYKAVLSGNTRLNNKFKSLQESWAQHRK